MNATVRPQLSHMGIYVTDLDRMVTFYERALGMRVTDRGMAMMFPVEVAFLSSDPRQHHQLALAKRRPPEGNMVEIYLDTPFHMTQPFAVPLDLDKPDDDIWRETELVCR